MITNSIVGTSEATASPGRRRTLNQAFHATYADTLTIASREMTVRRLKNLRVRLKKSGTGR